ncbi:hypothetical protein JCM1840_001118 [Sporobolomyces johnsonii]
MTYIDVPLLVDGPTVQAELSYFTGRTTDGEKPWSFIGQVAEGKPSGNAISELRSVQIHDLRPLIDAGKADETSVDKTGFQVPKRDFTGTSMRYEDWADERKVKEVYYKEVEELLKNVTGATKVIIFDHTERRPAAPGAGDSQKRGPVSRVHVDQTQASGEKRVHRHAGSDADRLLRGKASLINVWRPLKGPVQDVPLAVCDARTLSIEDDVVPSRLVYPPEAGFEGETSQVKFSERHAWYFLGGMQPDEALLLKCWDHDPSRSDKITPHSAFTDPRFVGKDVEPRESIEVRALVFVEPEEEE